MKEKINIPIRCTIFIFVILCLYSCNYPWWDSSARAVKNYLSEHLKDPDSLEIIKMGPKEQFGNSGNETIIRCKYRAKNSFGGYVVADECYIVFPSQDEVFTCSGVLKKYTTKLQNSLKEHGDISNMPEGTKEVSIMYKEYIDGILNYMRSQNMEASIKKIYAEMEFESTLEKLRTP